MTAPGYLVFAWREGDAGDAAARAWSAALGKSPAWSLASDSHGLQIWVKGLRPPPVAVRADGQLRVIGHLFGQGSACSDLPPSAARPLAGRLVERAWGPYVAVLRDATGEAFVLRDPTGALDALTWSRGPIAAVASDLEDLPPELGPPQIALDWDVIAGWLRDSASHGGACAFEGVETLPPGALCTLRPGAPPPDQVWSAARWALAVGPPIGELEEALRDTVDRVVGAWASVAGPVLLETSGGFDSSVVAAAWGRRAAPENVLACFNMFGDRAESDERPWASAVADALGRPLVAVEKPLTPWTEADFRELAQSARPAFNALDSRRDRLTAELAERLGVRSIVTGQGGDAVFLQMPSPLVLADFARDRGPFAWFGPTARHLARRFRKSVWSTALDARAGAAGRPRALSPLAGPRVHALGDRSARHPWLVGPENVRPGKRLQLEALAATHISFGRCRRAEAADLIHPLMSQPVLELALSIPTWELVRGGRERGLARDAFAPWLPMGIAQRRSKGALTSFYARQTAASLDFLRPYLLEGAMTEAGVLDRTALEAALTPEHLIWRAGSPPVLLRAAAIEAWVRHWQARVPDSATSGRRRDHSGPEARRTVAA